MTRTLAIGDIHGCLTALNTLIDFVAPGSNDTVVTLGDYIDRGPESKGVVDRMLDESHEFDLVCLQGNHEVMLKQSRTDEMAFRSWVAAGGKETLESYRPAEHESLSLDDITANHWQFFDRQLLRYYETESHIFVHANPHPHKPMSEQSNNALYWQFRTSPERHCSGKTIIRGHITQPDGLPLDGPHSICIDTGAHDAGWLTAFDPASGDVWQANEASQTRHFDIEQPPN